MDVAVGAVVGLVCAIWVAIDASRLGVRRGSLSGGFFDMGVVGWFLCVWLIWIIGFPAYLATRGKYLAQRAARTAPQLGTSTVWAPGQGGPYAGALGAPGTAAPGTPHAAAQGAPYAGAPYAGAPYAGAPYTGAPYAGAPTASAGQAPAYGVAQPPGPPAGWYPDPTAPGSFRWWDGRQWGPSAAPPPNG